MNLMMMMMMMYPRVFFILFTVHVTTLSVSQTIQHRSHSQLPRVLRRGSAAVRLLGLWVRIPPGVGKSVSCKYCEVSGRNICVGLITRPEESYRVSCVLVWSWSLNNEETLAQKRAVVPWGKSKTSNFRAINKLWVSENGEESGVVYWNVLSVSVFTGSMWKSNVLDPRFLFSPYLTSMPYVGHR
jgi:hypothetical protein